VLPAEVQIEAVLRDVVAAVTSTLRPGAMVGAPVSRTALLKGVVSLPAALLQPSPLLLPGLRLLPAALRLLRLRKDRTLLSLRLLLWLSALLLLFLLRTLLLRCLLRALGRRLGLPHGLLLLRLRWARRLLFWGLLSALLRLPGTLLVALLSRCLLLPRRLLLGLGHALLLSRRCLLPVSLRLFPALLLFWFVVALRVSGYDQSGKQANCSGGRSTWEFHFH